MTCCWTLKVLGSVDREHWLRRKSSVVFEEAKKVRRRGEKHCYFSFVEGPLCLEDVSWYCTLQNERDHGREKKLTAGSSGSIDQVHPRLESRIGRSREETRMTGSCYAMHRPCNTVVLRVDSTEIAQISRAF